MTYFDTISPLSYTNAKLIFLVFPTRSVYSNKLLFLKKVYRVSRYLKHIHVTENYYFTTTEFTWLSLNNRLRFEQ